MAALQNTKLQPVIEYATPCASSYPVVVQCGCPEPEAEGEARPHLIGQVVH